MVIIQSVVETEDKEEVEDVKVTILVSVILTHR